MPRMMPIPAEYATYVTNHVRNSAPFTQIPESATAFYYLERLWRVILLNFEVCFAPEKVAQVFAMKMRDVQQNPTELTYELSWLTDTQISLLQVHLGYSQRNLDIVHSAILQTKLAHKQIELVELALALKRKPPTIIVLTPAQEKAIRKEVKRMLTPAQRETMRAVADLGAITIDTMKGCDLKPNLQRKPAPFYNHVQQLAGLLDLKDSDHILPLLEQLDIMSLLYLYETTKKYAPQPKDSVPKNIPQPIYHRQLKTLIVNKYMEIPREEDKTAAECKMVFKTYLETNKKGLGKNDTRYIHLLSEIERAEHERHLVVQFKPRAK